MFSLANIQPFQCKNNKTGEVVAIKKIKLESEDEGVSYLSSIVFFGIVAKFFVLGAFYGYKRDCPPEGASTSKHCLSEGCSDAGGISDINMTHTCRRQSCI